jgi:hypothetical protein
VTLPHETPAGLRRCALALHALHAHDREWMLARLDSGAAEDVRRLLAEIVELGLPREGSIVKQALASHASCDAAAPEAWADALSHEPLALVAMALRDLQDERRESVLQVLGALRERHVRLRLQEQRQINSRAPRLQEAIAAALRERLSVAGTPRAASPWSRAWRRLRGARA